MTRKQIIEKYNESGFIQDTLDDLVIDMFLKQASEINNQGAEKQIKFLESKGMKLEDIAIEIGATEEN